MARTPSLILPILLATANLALAQPTRFPQGSVDYVGYTTWSDLGELSEAERSAYQSLLNSEASAAKAKFDALLRREPERPLLILGLAQARRLRSETIPTLSAENQKFEGYLIRRKEVPESLLLSYGLTWAFQFRQYLAKWDAGGSSPPAVNYSVSHLKWRGEILKRLAVVRSKDRSYSLIQASIFMALNDNKTARQVASAALAREGGFYQMRLLHAAMLNGGSVMRTRGGKPIPVPEDERPYPERAKQEAIRVTKDAPRWAIGWYVAGYLIYGSDKAKGRQYLQHYLMLNPTDATRTKRVKELLAKG